MAAIIGGSKEQQTWYEGEGIIGELTNSDSETDSYGSSVKSEGIPTPEEEEPRLVTESGQLVVMLADLVKSLLKLSIIIQKSSRRAKFAQSSREKPYETNFDILHAKELFPYATKHGTLLERLGKANAQRRQWLSYRRRHRERLSSLEDPNSEPVETGSQPSSNLASIVSFSSRPAFTYTTSDNSTTATTFYESTRDTVAQRDTDEESSEVSFSTSSVSGNEKTSLEILSLPSEAASGDPFECPFCFSILAVSGLQSWM